MKKITILLLILLLTTFSFAHSGKTDSKGGHYNRSTGEYHYHHGYPAHSVCGVNCPYNNIDATNHHSSSSSKSSNSKATTFIYSTHQLSFWEKIVAAAAISFFTSPLTTFITWCLLCKFKYIYDKIGDYIWIIGYIESILIFYFLL